MVRGAALARRGALPALRLDERAGRGEASAPAVPVPRLPEHRFSTRTGTILADSNIGYRDWALAIYLVLTNLKGVSSMKLHRDLGVTQKTAWFMLHRIREAMTARQAEPFEGPVEADETYVGGKSANMHASRRERLGIKPGRSIGHKTAVAGVKDRASNRVAAWPVPDASAKSLTGIVAGTVSPDASVFTDEWPSYRALAGSATATAWSPTEHASTSAGMPTRTGSRACGRCSSAATTGTYHKMSKAHLHRYVHRVHRTPQHPAARHRRADGRGRRWDGRATVALRRVDRHPRTSHSQGAVLAVRAAVLAAEPVEFLMAVPRQARQRGVEQSPLVPSGTLGL